MKIKLLRDIRVPSGPSYKKGQYVIAYWPKMGPNAGRIFVGASANGVEVEYGVDFVPYWDENYLREKMNIKAPTVREKDMRE